ncbi:hypothetical protein FOA43_001886 [Brettanomyces nanus]|uniref:TLC domain-containing protein n=1 Tax=Eeniella nana TaxID=13502 RepID=A0A875S2J1_EENNA|nr:uncharacterized protein FOA43_001886 [Brettanomyces nanus]QPG74555.1 hypothetical protein FOA43_001886 [Brettanomyces nanus]
MHFCIRIVSLFQSVIICLLSLGIIGNQYLKEDHIFSVIPYSEFYASMALGYFIFDAIISLYYLHYFGLGFAIHGLVSLVVTYLALDYGFIHYYSAAFLLFELSTPFLDIRWFGLKFGTEVFPAWFQLANNVVLIVVFFCARIVWGWYQFGYLLVDFYKAYTDPRFPVFGAFLIIVSNLTLDALNVYWFGKMVTVAIGIIKKKTL